MLLDLEISYLQQIVLPWLPLPVQWRTMHQQEKYISTQSKRNACFIGLGEAIREFVRIRTRVIPLILCEIIFGSVAESSRSFGLNGRKVIESMCTSKLSYVIEHNRKIYTGLPSGPNLGALGIEYIILDTDVFNGELQICWGVELMLDIRRMVKNKDLISNYINAKNYRIIRVKLNW